MVESGNGWDALANGDVRDEEFENLLNIFDFPMENFEGDEFVGDWETSKSQCLGPIPSNVLISSTAIPNAKINIGSSCLVPEPEVPIDAVPDKKVIGEASGSDIPQQNKFVDIHDLGAFGTQSPNSVLESSGSCSSGKSLPTKPDNTDAIPVRPRSKRLRIRRTGVSPWGLKLPWFASASISKKTSNPRKKSVQQLNSVQSTKNTENSSWKNARVGVTKKCTHCEVTKTPQWREGPLGPKTLCNACGVRYRSGRLLPEYRPAASPTFVPSLHSNSHKKVIEMRNKSNHLATVEAPPVSPLPEFVPISSYLFDNQLLPFPIKGESV